MSIREQDESSQPTATSRAALPRGRWAQLLGRLGNHQTLLSYSSASVLGSLSAATAGFIVYRWIGPDVMGLWQSILLIQVYASVIQAGVIAGLNRELPFHLGAGDEQRATDLAAAAQGIVLLTGLVSILGGTVALLTAGEQVRYGIAVVAAAFAATLYQAYLGSTFRAERAFAVLARLRLVDACLEMLTLPLVFYFGYTGLAGRYLLNRLVSTALLHFFRPLRAPVRVHWRHTAMLLKVGTPLFACGYLFSVSDTFPNVILLSAPGGGPELVGLFAPACAVMGLVQMVPNSIGGYIYAQMSYRLGKTGDPASLWPMAWKTAAVSLVMSLPMIAVAELVVPWLIAWFVPKYVESTTAVRWGIVAGAFLGASISLNALFSLKSWRWLAVYTTSRLCTAFLAPFLLLHACADPMEGVAIGYTLSHVLMFALAMYCIYRATHPAAPCGTLAAEVGGAAAP